MSKPKLVQKIVNLTQAKDPKAAKAALLKELGKAAEDYELFNDDVLLAIYIPTENMKDGHIITAAGLYLPQQKTEEMAGEHLFQGKLGLIVKKGPIAFKYDSSNCKFEGRVPDDHDWVVFRPSDGWSVSLNGVSCRIIRSCNIRGCVSDPSVIW